MLAGSVPNPAAFAQQASHAPIVREAARNAGSVTLELAFPEPDFDTTKEGIRLRPFSGFDQATGEFALPVALGRGSITVIKQDIKDLALGETLIQSTPEYKAYDKSPSLAVSSSPGLSLGEARLEYIGKVSRADASRIRLGAVSYDRPSSMLRYVKQITLRVTASTIPQGKLSDLGSAIKLAERARRSPAKQAANVQNAIEKQGIVSDDGKVHKFVIDRDGLYKLTYDDLRNFGLNPDDIDLPTLRLVHNDAQVPIYIFDKQDGRLSPGDYIEFWGERKILNYESKFRDMYFDPYTRESIYYLVWGTKHSPIQYSQIKRIVEESGEVRVGDPNLYVDLKDSSFASRIHIEEDDRYEYLSQTDINELSTLRDHWFTAEIRRGGSFEIQVEAPYPDGGKNSPLKIRAGLHGFSLFDKGYVDYSGNEVPDVPNEQEASISVNGSLVLWDTWDSQQLKFISSDSAHHLVGGVAPTTRLMRWYDIRFGWPLTFMVQHTKATDVQSRFGLNWIDIEYDRLYSAWNNELVFKIPRDSRSGFYQFTLGGFSRSDISIYRKGVSKISNVFISATTPGAPSIQCIFQAPVSGTSEEFIALSDSSKLKPKLYMVDDHLDLRNAQNAADYILISSRDLLKKDAGGIESSPLQHYIRRAERKGMKPKLIDVANIYDEFNGGSKSPEAIKEFLKYAYDHWSVAPKHVVLVGRHEQVPTPYIQSFRLGSISSDAWYS
ncbi:MAG TPA: C25 family cysteine peptidase, partial [Candidatus Kapabacteria bacterium]|nr:C25 family cysteine peptidase [Candidatus Kapabacteria bacterium]